MPRALASMMLPLPSLAPRNDFGSPSPTILAGRSAGHAAMPRSGLPHPSGGNFASFAVVTGGTGSVAGRLNSTGANTG